MFRIALLIVLAVPALAIADTIPKSDRNPVKVEGTTWEGEDSLGHKWKCTFHKDGDLGCTLDGTSSIASWKQDDKKLYWECTNRYAEFEGTIEKGELRMEAHNITGLKWTITFKPAKDPPAKP